MSAPPKIFDVPEANALLGSVAPLVEQLQGLQHSIFSTQQAIDTAKEQLSHGNGHPVQELKARIEELTKRQLLLVEAFQSAMQQLEALGALLKDLNQGLVDFYSLRDGELVFLCWRLGEERIGYWHGIDDGFAGRQPLS